MKSVCSIIFFFLFSFYAKAEEVLQVEVDDVVYIVKQKRGQAIAIPETIRLMGKINSIVKAQCTKYDDAMAPVKKSMEKYCATIPQDKDLCAPYIELSNDLRYKPSGMLSTIPAEIIVPIQMAPVGNAEEVEKILSEKTGYKNLRLLESPWLEENYDLSAFASENSWIAFFRGMSMGNPNIVRLQGAGLRVLGRDAVCDLQRHVVLIRARSSTAEEIEYDPPGMKWNTAWNIYKDITNLENNVVNARLLSAILIGARINVFLAKHIGSLYKDEDILKVFDSTYREDLTYKTYGSSSEFRYQNFKPLVDTIEFSTNYVFDITGI